MIRAAFAALVVALVVAGCGGGDDTGSDTTTGGEATTAVGLYFLRDGQVWPVARQVAATEGVATEDVARAALEELEAGPTGDEADALGAETAVEEGSLDLDSLTIADGVVQISSSGELSAEAEAQVVYTLTQLGTVESVELDGNAVTRDDYEEQTPAVLVEFPLPFEQVASPLEATGTANTFEATFSFEILDSAGEVIASDFVTATSGSGTRGTFTFSQPFVVDGDQDGTLVVFELSAEDGSRTNEVEIPIALQE